MSKPAQSLPSPFSVASGVRPGIRDLGWLARFAVRGLYELARARIIFARLAARDIVARNRRVEAWRGTGADAAKGPDRLLLARVAYVLPRISHRLPWRSDCLVQAIAGQNWLEANGHASAVRIGVEHPEEGPFGAHAWLICDGYVVTGGNVARYDTILDEQYGGSGR